MFNMVGGRVCKRPDGRLADRLASYIPLYGTWVLIVAALNLNGRGTGAVEQDLDFDILPAGDALSVREVFQLGGWTESYRKVPVASLDVENVAGTHCAGCDPLYIQSVQFARIGLIIAANHVDFRCCEAAISVGGCLY